MSRLLSTDKRTILRDEITRTAGNLDIEVIDDAIANFLREQSERSGFGATEMHKTIMKSLHTHLNLHGPDILYPVELKDVSVQSQSFTAGFHPQRCIALIERFLRHCLYRELDTTDYMRECFSTVVFRFCYWMHSKRLMGDEDLKMIRELQERLEALETKAASAKRILCQSTQIDISDKLRGNRLDVLRTMGDAIWLTSPANRWMERFPIRIGRDAASLLEPGWILEGTISTETGRPSLKACMDVLPAWPQGA